MQLLNVLVVGLGGGLGAVLRYVLKLYYPGIWGTTAVNIIGCFAIGLLIIALQKSTPVYFFIVIGVLGGFTTFSSFAIDALDSGKSIKFDYVLISTMGGLLACYLGLSLGRYLNG